MGLLIFAVGFLYILGAFTAYSLFQCINDEIARVEGEDKTLTEKAIMVMSATWVIFSFFALLKMLFSRNDNNNNDE